MGKRKVPVEKDYHIRYVSDVVVRATGTKEAYAKSDEFMLNSLVNPELELDDIFEITLETDRFHIVPNEYFMDDDESDEDSDECDCGDDCDCDDEDDDEEDDDDEDSDEEDEDEE
jgi:hypothetical protein